MLLEMKNLHVDVEETPIIKGLNLQVKRGEIHALMGPNGAGKSTLAKVLMGHPDYTITQGKILFEGKNILELEVEERAHLGLFIGFQYPVEVAGVSNRDFLFHAVKAVRNLDEEAFEKLLREKLLDMKMKPESLERDLNCGFSGGEKKRNEILQMALLEPKLAILDETDSGLDVDAMRIVADGVNRHMNSDRGLVLITHYQRLLDYIKPDFVHIVMDGAIVQSGGPELALEIEKNGYPCLTS